MVIFSRHIDNSTPLASTVASELFALKIYNYSFIDYLPFLVALRYSFSFRFFIILLRSAWYEFIFIYLVWLLLWYLNLKVLLFHQLWKKFLALFYYCISSTLPPLPTPFSFSCSYKVYLYFFILLSMSLNCFFFF